MQMVGPALAVQLQTIPTVAFDFDLVGLQGNGGGYISGLDVDAADEAVGGKLKVGRIAGSAHQDGVTILIELDGGHGRQGGAFGHGARYALAGWAGIDTWGRRGQDASAGGGQRGGIFQVGMIVGGYWCL